MVQQLTWQSLSHQLRILNEGSSLLTKIFSNSNQREISVEDLALLPEYKEGTADILIKYGVLVEDNGFVGIENPHLDYFLESQAGNHHISVGVIKDLVDQLDMAIRNYQTEKSEKKKRGYLRTVQKVLRQVSLQTVNQTTVLKYEIREVYKQETNLEKKVSLLEKYHEQGNDIYKLIEESQRMIDGESIFFDINCDESTKQLKSEVYKRLISCHQWLSDISEEALENLTKFREKIIRNKKIRTLKKILDMQTLEGETDIVERIKIRQPLWLNKPSYPKYRVSVQDIIKLPAEKITEMLKAKGITAKRRPEAAAFTDEETNPEKKIVVFIDEDTIWNRFRSSSTDLLSFILSRQLTQNGTWNENVNLFCRLVDMHVQECRFNGYIQMNGFIMPIVRPMT